MNILLLLMGGSGIRLGSNIPKQYIKVNDIPIFAYILNEYNKLSVIDKIIIVSNKDYIDYVTEWVKKLKAEKVYKICPGGVNRSSSVLNGLKVAYELDSNGIVLLHDATHPYVDKEGVNKVIENIKEYGAATLVQGNYDTVYEINDNVVTKVLDRKNVVSGASPEGFQLSKIYEIYSNATEKELERMTSAGAIAIANGMTLKTIETDTLNLKITFQRDLALFQKLVDNYYFPDEGKK